MYLAQVELLLAKQRKALECYRIFVNQKKRMNFAAFLYLAGIVLTVALVACDTLPRGMVVLSNTVGRDLEEVHRAHRELAQLHFARMEADVNLFIDETYRPEFIKAFAKEFKLASKIRKIIKSDPDSLLPVMTRFVQVATERIEKKREEILTPMAERKLRVIAEIDAAHRRIQAAHNVVTAHLASVRQVREAQNGILAEVGFENVREKVIAPPPIYRTGLPDSSKMDVRSIRLCKTPPKK